jgi:hypothetical protein
MKLLFIVALFAFVVSAQSVYTATSGEITLTAMAWSTTKEGRRGRGLNAAGGESGAGASFHVNYCGLTNRLHTG